MQVALTALIVIAAVAVLTRKWWRTARTGSSCHCANDCDGCSGCPAEAAARKFSAGAPPK